MARVGRNNSAGNGSKAKRGRSGNGNGRTSVPLVLNLAPMVDVTFLLLIFFSVTTTFKLSEGYLATKLPSAQSAASVPLPVSPIVVRVVQTGPGAGEYQLKIDQFMRRPASFAELSDFLTEIQGQPGFGEETPVVIASEEDVVWDHVVNCWNAAVRAGCKNIVFGGE